MGTIGICKYILYACVNSDCMCGLSGHGKKFRHISFKEFGHVDVHKILREFVAQIAAGGSYQIKHNRDMETGSSFQRFRHGFHTCISDISKIQCQCMRASGDLSYFCRMFCHDRAASGRQNNISAVMNRNRISDAVNQRLGCSGQLSGICLIYGHIFLLQGFVEIWQAFLRDLMLSGKNRR